MMQLFLDKKYEKCSTLSPGEYEGCAFLDCSLPQADLSQCVFSECTFVGCDLSLAKLAGTALREASFKGCKMLGLRFDDCNPLGLSVTIEGCIADHCSFFEVKLPRAVIRETRLHEADFSGCDLSGATLEGCDLSGTIFDGTVLEKADLRGSYGISLDPAKNRIKRARFSLSALPGLLEEHNLEIDRTT